MRRRHRHPAPMLTAVGRRRLGSARRLILAALAVTATIAVGAAPALALSEQGHVFASTVGGPGEGADEFNAPGQLAVDEATHDLYVVDRGNNRVEKLGPKGEFIATWGWGVKDGKKEFQVCTSACQAGIAGSGKGQLDVPGAIAVDNSTSNSDPSKGDVYVVTDARSEHGRLVKFTPNGEVVGSLKQEGEERFEGALDGVAVDSTGMVWVYRGTEEEGHIESFSDAERAAFEEPALEPQFLCPKPGFAVDATGEHFYLGHERENREELCPLEEGEPVRPVVAGKAGRVEEALESEITALDPQNTTAIAADSATGSVYLANGTSVAAYGSGGSLIQRFGAEQLTAASGVAVDASSDDVYIADSSTDRVDVFEPETAGIPTIDLLAAENLTATSARFEARIDPDGADTHYYFQYGTADCVTTPSSCTDTVAPPGADIGAGFSAETVSAEVLDLQASTTYHYRVVAVNAHGEAEGAESLGTITTLPTSSGVLLDGRAWEMVSPAEKDGSGIEPLRLDGGLIQASEDGDAITYVANGPVVPEPEGNRGPYPTQILSTRGLTAWSTQQIVTPHTKGEGFELREDAEYRAFSPDLSVALVQPDVGVGEPLEQPPLAPGASEKTMYLRDNPTGEYEPVVTPASDTAEPRTPFGEKLEFVSASPDLSHVVFESHVALTANSAPGLYEWSSGQALQPVSVLPDGVPASEPKLGAESSNVRGAVSEDGTRVIWSGESQIEGHEQAQETVNHLYMTDTATGGTIQLDAAVSPIAEPGEEESEVAFQGASANGGRVFFTDTARLTEASDLEPEPSATDNPGDLYECEIREESGKLSCQLTDLTADQNPGEAADVLNVVPGISETGTYVYFVANGVLAPGATRGDCVAADQEEAPAGATCNLYVHHAGKITFVATVSNEDSGDWGSLEGEGERSASSLEPRPDLADVTSRVSPDGEYFAFMSDRPLTGYDNVDASPEAAGARDEEVYLYDAASKLVVCVSCDSSGQPPFGVHDTEDAGEGLGLVVDRRGDWRAIAGNQAATSHYLAGSIPGWTPLGAFGGALHQPRYLLDSGRLFFNSPADLVPAAKNGKNDVYEYEPRGVGNCTSEDGCVALISAGTSAQESAFVDASANGDDAFFVTSEPLVGQDQDTNFDLYDARVCAQSGSCLTQSASKTSQCVTSETCNSAPATPALSIAPSGTATLSGPANVSTSVVGGTVEAPKKTLTRAQKLASALKVCRRRWKHAKRKRGDCEQRAERTFGHVAKRSHKPSTRQGR
jgi:DNA-binding beta-propeller fold protein YncE